MSARFVLFSFEHFKTARNRLSPKLLIRAVFVSPSGEIVVRYYDCKSSIDSDIKQGMKLIESVEYRRDS